MAKKYRKVKKQKARKPSLESGFFFKNISGKRQRYVKVVIRSPKKRTITKQFKWRGGNKDIYIREARLPRGVRYRVSYTKGIITRSKDRISEIDKKVKEKQVSMRVKGRKPKIKEVREVMRIVPKITRHPPKPTGAEKIVKLLDGKVYYEREHPISDFATKPMEDKFLLDILYKATKRKEYAKSLLQNFDKIKLKMSYEVKITGYDEKGNMKDEIGRFSAIGMKPSEIVKIIKDTGLTPGEAFVEIDSDKIKDFKQQLSNKVIGAENQNLNAGKYRISEVKMMVKFYNNPQKQLFSSGKKPGKMR